MFGPRSSLDKVCEQVQYGVDKAFAPLEQTIDRNDAALMAHAEHITALAIRVEAQAACVPQWRRRCRKSAARAPPHRHLPCRGQRGGVRDSPSHTCVAGQCGDLFQRDKVCGVVERSAARACEGRRRRARLCVCAFATSMRATRVMRRVAAALNGLADVHGQKPTKKPVEPMGDADFAAIQAGVAGAALCRLDTTLASALSRWAALAAADATYVVANGGMFSNIDPAWTLLQRSYPCLRWHGSGRFWVRSWSGCWRRG